MIVAAILLAAMPGAAAKPPSDSVGGVISTHATSHRRLPNTVSDVRASLDLPGTDEAATTALLAQKTAALLVYLKGAGVERLTTAQTSVVPQLERQPQRPPRITGYIGHGDVTFRTTPERLAQLMAGCLDHGANGIEQYGSAPREEEVMRARQDLAEDAARMALAQARAIAAAVGERLGDVQEVDVDPAERGSGLFVPAPAPMALAAPRMPDALPAAAGETEISVTVSMRARVMP